MLKQYLARLYLKYAGITNLSWTTEYFNYQRFFQHLVHGGPMNPSNSHHPPPSYLSVEAGDELLDPPDTTDHQPAQENSEIVSQA